MKVLVTGLVSLFLLSATAVLAQPKLQVSTGTKIEMGDVYQGQKAERVVYIRNIGTDTLKINEVKAQCGCTATLMTEKNLAPGDSGKLNISFNTTGQNGKVGKEVYVTSNDPQTPKVSIGFTANVLQALDVAPRYVTFDNVKVDSTYTKVVTITNPSMKESVKILSVDTKMDDVKATLMKNQLMPGESTQLQLVLHPNKPGSQNGVLELVTDHKVQPKFEVKVFAFVNRK